MITNRFKPFIAFACLLSLWQILVMILDLPPYILPSPDKVIISLYYNAELLWENTLITMSEMLLGLIFGVITGVILALTLASFAPLRPWLLPILLLTQAIPTFAMAPIIMLWFGYGLTSKVVVTILMIFFPVAICCYDGLRHVNSDWMEMAKTMGGNRYAIMKHIRWPFALPALASGLRMAVITAPIAAVIGEWTGSSAGLGYMMLQANARLWVDQMFAALTVLAFCSISLYFVTDSVMRWLIPWQKDASNNP